MKIYNHLMCNSIGIDESLTAKDIQEVLDSKELSDLGIDKSVVGIKSPLKQIIELLDLRSAGVRFIGICGMSGIGKTTLAHITYQITSHKFEKCCFISGIGEKDNNGITDLQKQLISVILKEEAANSSRTDEEVTKALKIRLRTKKVLVVLDDVCKRKQVDALAESPNWFKEGSRIILTSKDRHLLQLYEANIYDVEELNEDAATQLFCSRAFKDGHPEEKFKRWIKPIVEVAKGHPLALDIFGSYLRGEEESVWKSYHARITEKLDPDVYEKLQITFDSLKDPATKQAFLDIVVFYNRMSKKEIIFQLKCLGYHSETILKDLERLSLIKFSKDQTLCIHDLLCQMGKEIVGKSRLLKPEDIISILNIESEMNEVRGIFLHQLWLLDEEKLSKAFSTMKKLRIFVYRGFRDHILTKFYDISKFKFSTKLCIVEWSNYPFNSLPDESNFNPTNLGALILKYSCIDQLWNGQKDFSKLKHINLSMAEKLIEMPDLSIVPNLEILDLSCCWRLSKAHPSIERHVKLKKLLLQGCHEREKLSDKIRLISLEVLNLACCFKLERFPEIEGNMSSLKDLNISCSGIRQLPLSFKRLRSLEKFDAHQSLSSSLFTETPDKPKDLFLGFSSLLELNLSKCNLRAIPEDLGCCSSLTSLKLSGNKFTKLPESLGKLSVLEELSLSDCSEVKEWPMAFSKLDLRSLSKLDLRSCNLLEIPKDLGHCSLLSDLDLSYNNFTKLPESLCQHSVLQKLSLSHCCEIENLSEALSSGFRSLLDLDLSYCNISDGGILQNLGCRSSLSVLRLSGNKFTELPAESLCKPSVLHWLALDNCASLRSVPKLPLTLGALQLTNCPGMEAFDEKRDTWRHAVFLKSQVGVRPFTVAYIGFDAKPYKVLYLPSQCPIWKDRGYHRPAFEVAYGPIRVSEIPKWFDKGSTTENISSRAIKIYLKNWDLGSLGPKGCALMIVCKGDNHMFPEFVCEVGCDKPSPNTLVFCLPKISHVGPNGMWVHIKIPYDWLESCKRSYWVSIASVRENVEFECTAGRLLDRYGDAEFFREMINISEGDLDPRSFYDSISSAPMTVFGPLQGTFAGECSSVRAYCRYATFGPSPMT